MIAILSMTVLGIWTGLLAFFNSREERPIRKSRNWVRSENPRVETPVCVADKAALPVMPLKRDARVFRESEVWSAFRDLLNEVFYGR